MSEKIAYLGPDRSTFGYMAAEKFFGNNGDVEFISYPTHTEIARIVGRGAADHGVLAIENVIDGVITETARAIEEVDGRLGLKIHHEVLLPIQLFYLRKELTDTAPRKVLTHVSPIRQCSRFLGEIRKKGISVEVADSTGKAAEEASKDPEIAVIASAKAEEIYGLKRVIPDSIADLKKNFTRFWVVGKSHAQKELDSRMYKTCFLLNLEQAKPGALAEALAYFGGRKINMLLINPNPIPGRLWEYTFLLEFMGHIDDPEMESAYTDLRDSGLSLTPLHFLGSYLAATNSNS